MNGPASTAPCRAPPWPARAAIRKKTVAVSIESMCQVAVHQSGEPHSIVSQSSKPVRAVKAVAIRPTTSASHQPCAAETFATPTTLATAITVAAVYAPIVTSVSGGGVGVAGGAFHREIHFIRPDLNEIFAGVVLAMRGS